MFATSLRSFSRILSRPGPTCRRKLPCLGVWLLSLETLWFCTLLHYIHLESHLRRSRTPPCLLTAMMMMARVARARSCLHDKGRSISRIELSAKNILTSLASRYQNLDVATIANHLIRPAPRSNFCYSSAE
ncbi:hypothetical protein BST61_g1491 [Cercospora zeina]